MPPQNRTCTYTVLDDNHVDCGDDFNNNNATGGSSRDVKARRDENLNLYEYKRGNYEFDRYQEADRFTAFMVQFHLVLMTVVAVINQFLRSWKVVKTYYPQERPEQKDFVELKDQMESIYINKIYRFASDILNRPIASVPGAVVTLKDRVTRDFGWTYSYPGTHTEVTCVGSYNYLGFSQNSGPCSNKAAEFIDKYGISGCTVGTEFAQHGVHDELEKQIARFMGTEDAVLCSMGYGTNAMNLPALAGRDTLVLSDKLNHASLIRGLRSSNAKVVIFKHNDHADCERQLRDAFARFAAEHGRKPAKILIILEGIYSMEGTIVNLPAFIEVKKRNKAFLYIDEAHSVGALGPSGRGIVDYWGCDPRDVDCLMGTLTKSFAAAGGYIAGDKKLIDFLKARSVASAYGSNMSPALIGQIRASMKIISGEDGTQTGKRKFETLLRNTRYFRRRCQQLGYVVYGQEDSPVVPLPTFYISKVVAAAREALDLGVGLIGVGYPATPIHKARLRIALSSDLTKAQLDEVLSVLDVVGDRCRIKYGQNPFPQGYCIEY